MQIKLLKAVKGDSFLLNWGLNKENSILIDGGSPGAYKNIITSGIDFTKLNAIIITHVDYDHIGGIIKLLENNTIEITCPIYINTPELILMTPKGDMVATKHGDLLSNLALIRKLKLVSIYENVNDCIEINGLKLTTYLPSYSILKELINKWSPNLIFENFKKENEKNIKVSIDSPNLKSVEEILSEKEVEHSIEYDLINASSVVFLVEINSKRILFLGDTIPSLIVSKLKDLGYNEEKPLEVEVVKLSHHGSKFNTSKELLKLIKTNKYIISTNGSGYSHPDRETIVKIAKLSKRLIPNEPIEFWFNYDLEEKKFLLEGEKEKYNFITKYTNCEKI